MPKKSEILGGSGWFSHVNQGKNARKSLEIKHLGIFGCSSLMLNWFIGQNRAKSLEIKHLGVVSGRWFRTPYRYRGLNHLFWSTWPCCVGRIRDV